MESEEIIQALLSVESDQQDLMFLLDVLLRIDQEEIGIEELLALGPQLIQARERFLEFSLKSREVIERCMRLKPTPASKPPHGF